MLKIFNAYQLYTRTLLSMALGIVIASLSFFIFHFSFLTSTRAQEYTAQQLDQTETQEIFPADEHMRGRVVEIIKEGEEDIAGYTRQYQDVKIEILSGNDQGKIIDLRHGSVFDLKDAKKVQQGDQVVVTKSTVVDESTYFITDFYRAPTLLWIAIAFAILIIALGKWQGITSLIGLGLSVIIITSFTVPQLVRGSSPELITLATAYVIAIVSMILAHGTKKRTLVAIGGTLITLTIAVVLTYIFLVLAKLSGVGSEEAYTLQLGPLKDVDLRGLLFGGIIIGTLGVLDDITTAQAATVEEISKANPELSTTELYKRGFSVGNEHIASLVNTLFLAYAGASLPLFLIFTINQTEPMWMTLNSEYIAEEIIRTIVGSAALILAVPITTLLSARLLKHQGEPIKTTMHTH